jgi:hypothetical protein
LKINQLGFFKDRLKRCPKRRAGKKFSWAPIFVDATSNATIGPADAQRVSAARAAEVEERPTRAKSSLFRPQAMGIRPIDIPGFLAAEFAGGVAGAMMFGRVLRTLDEV